MLIIYKTYVEVALEHGQTDVVKFFIQKNGVNDKTAEKLLFDAAIDGKVPVMDALISAGVDANSEVCFVFTTNMGSDLCSS